MENPHDRAPDSAQQASHLRRVLSWVWALSPLLTVGIATAPIMIVATKRVRHWLHITLSVVYTVMAVLLLTFAGSDDGTVEDAVFSWALGVNMLAGTGHAFWIRSRALGLEAAPGPPPSLARQQHALEQQRQSEELRTVARRIAENEPARAVDLRIGRVDLQARDFPDGGLLDVNNVDPTVLAAYVPVLTAYTESLAAGQQFGFSSPEELSVTLQLPPQALEAVSERLIFLPPYVSSRSDG